MVLGGSVAVTLFLDVLIVALLIVGIIYAIVLDNHLSATKENYRMLSRLIEQFYQAADKTQTELIKLKNTQEKSRKELLSEMEKALQLKNDLNLLADKIEKRMISLGAGNIRGPLPYEAETLLSALNEQNQEISQSDQELLLALKEIK